MGHAYDRQYLAIMKQVASKHHLELQEGIYCGLGASRLEIIRCLIESFHRSQVDLVMKPSLRSTCSDNSAVMPWVSDRLECASMTHGLFQVCRSSTRWRWLHIAASVHWAWHWSPTNVCRRTMPRWKPFTRMWFVSVNWKLMNYNSWSWTLLAFSKPIKSNNADLSHNENIFTHTQIRITSPSFLGRPCHFFIVSLLHTYWKKRTKTKPNPYFRFRSVVNSCAFICLYLNLFFTAGVCSWTFVLLLPLTFTLNSLWSDSHTNFSPWFSRHNLCIDQTNKFQDLLFYFKIMTSLRTKSTSESMNNGTTVECACARIESNRIESNRCSSSSVDSSSTFE